jgi:hypothetical protein
MNYVLANQNFSILQVSSLRNIESINTEDEGENTFYIFNLVLLVHLEIFYILKLVLNVSF